MILVSLLEFFQKKIRSTFLPRLPSVFAFLWRELVVEWQEPAEDSEILGIGLCHPMASKANLSRNPNGSYRNSGVKGAGNGRASSNRYFANGGMAHSGPSQTLKYDPGHSAKWTAADQAFLEEALCRYATDSNIVRYAKIAMLLEDKSVRDVAMRCAWMTKKESSNRRKEEHMARRNNDKKEKVVDHSAKPLVHVAARSSAPPYTFQMLAVESHDAIGGATGQLLEQNAQVFDQISANLTSFQIEENINLFCQSRDNILKILNGLNDMPGIRRQMPALPVELNQELANSILPRPPIVTQS